MLCLNWPSSVSSWIDVNNQLVWVSTAVLAYFKTLAQTADTHLQIPAPPVGKLTMPTSLSPGVDLVLLKIYFRDLSEGRKDSLWPGRCFPPALWWWICLWCSALLPLLLLCGWKWNRCTVTMHTHCGSGRTIPWSSCTDQCLLITGAGLAPALGAAWTPPQQDVTTPGILLVVCISLSCSWQHWGGCSQEQEGSCGWQSSFPRVSVCHKLLASMLWGLWAASCSREGSSQGLCLGPCLHCWMGRALL